MTEEHIRAALRDCYDPVLPCNVVDLGLVHRIDLAPDTDAPGSGIPGVPPKYRVHISLLRATEDEAASAQLIAQVANRLAGIEAISRTTVTQLADPVWSPQRITPAGRRLLGLDSNPHLVQIAPLHA